MAFTKAAPDQCALERRWISEFDSVEGPREGPCGRRPSSVRAVVGHYGV